MNKRKHYFLCFIFCILISGDNYACNEMKTYNNVSFENLSQNIEKYDKQAISVTGIYFGDKSVGALLFKNTDDFRSKKYKSAIYIANKKGAFVNVKYGGVVIVKGIFRAPREDELNLFFAEIIDVISVTGVPDKPENSPKP